MYVCVCVCVLAYDLHVRIITYIYRVDTARMCTPLLLGCFSKINYLSNTNDEANRRVVFRTLISSSIRPNASPLTRESLTRLLLLLMLLLLSLLFCTERFRMKYYGGARVPWDYRTSSFCLNRDRKKKKNCVLFLPVLSDPTNVHITARTPLLISYHV